MMVDQDVQRDALVCRIYDINEKDFVGVALDVWKYQFDFNPLYRSFCELLNVHPMSVQHLEDIPFMPVGFFKEHIVKTDTWDEQRIFRSSGTTGSQQSKHYVRDITLYHSVAEKGFEKHFGSPSAYTWIGLLPSYLERQDSSLVDMVHYFMQRGGKPANQFYPQINDQFLACLDMLKTRKEQTLLVGVSFALLDLFEIHKVPVWDELLVIETGGMKGRGKEITRSELYSRIKKHNAELQIESEYGMTELFSQAYSKDDHFQPGETMRVLIRDISDPLKLIGHAQRGVINVVDLANIDTCAFIATEDVGISYPNGTFDVLGRLDNSDIRGCNLLYV